VPSAGIESRLLDALIAALTVIGTPPTNWRTVPAVVDGIPSDPLPFADKPRIYVQWAGTEPGTGEAGTSTHLWRVSFAIWMTAATNRILLDLKRDVSAALFAAEETVMGTFKQPFWFGEAMPRNDMLSAGLYVASLNVWIDAIIDHSDP
jgi:hypothetical protein